MFERLTLAIVNVSVNSSMELTIDGLNIYISRSNMDSLYIILHNKQSLHPLVEKPKIFIHNSSFGKLDLLAGTEAIVTNCHIKREFTTRSTLISSYASSVSILNSSLLNFKTSEGPTVLHSTVNSTLHLINTAIIEHRSVHGAILIHKNCSVHMKNVNISHHMATGYGFPAVIFMAEVKASIYDSVFQSNSAVYGGVILSSHNCLVECNSCVFDGNHAVLGAAILVQYSSKLVITYSAILSSRGISRKKNSSFILELNKSHFEILLPLVKDLRDALSRGRGGAIYAHNSSSAQISRTTFRNNLANLGGAINAQDNSTLHIGRYSNFYGNMAEHGGVIWAGGGTSVHITGAYFHNNDAGNAGGVMLGQDQTTITLDNSVVNENHASYGGALFLEGKNSKFMVNDVNFTHNVASKSGGAVSVSGSVVVKLDSCKFISNEAVHGGAIDATNNGTVRLRNSVFARNKAESGGAIVGMNVEEVCISKRKQVFLIQLFIETNVHNLTL